MTRQELAVSLFAQQIAAAKMAIDVGNRLSNGEDIPDLLFRVGASRELILLFLSELGRVNPDFALLQRIIFVLGSLLNDYLLSGTIAVTTVQVTSYQPRNLVVQFTGEGGGESPNPVPYITTLLIGKGAFTPEYDYINYGLIGLSFSLTITGPVTLREGKDYMVYPSGGFKLINDVAMEDTDIITLTTVKAFNSIPVTPDQARYVKEDYVEDDYVE